MESGNRMEKGRGPWSASEDELPVGPEKFLGRGFLACVAVSLTFWAVVLIWA